MLEKIDTQLGEETYCQVTFEVDCAKGIPSTTLEAFASITRNGAKNVGQGSGFVFRPSRCAQALSPDGRFVHVEFADNDVMGFPALVVTPDIGRVHVCIGDFITDRDYATVDALD